MISILIPWRRTGSILVSHIICDDIANIPTDIIPSSDVVVGGFPCQGFSQANLRRTISDDRNRLYKEFLRVIYDKQPKYFLAENVRGILSLDDGNAIKTIVRDFKNANYRVKYKLFNLADYGVPQARLRVIIAGTRKDLRGSHEYQFPDQTHASNPSLRLPPWITIGEALKDIPEPDHNLETLPNHICSKYKVTNRNFTGHRWTNSEKPSPTILARGNGKGGVCAIQHPNNHRRLSIRESASVQTFPITYKFSGSMNSCYRQVGNAVPVLFAKMLGIQLKILEDAFIECA